jgi:hypothetical protein
MRPVKVRHGVQGAAPQYGHPARFAIKRTHHFQYCRCSSSGRKTVVHSVVPSGASTNLITSPPTRFSQRKRAAGPLSRSPTHVSLHRRQRPVREIHSASRDRVRLAGWVLAEIDQRTLDLSGQRERLQALDDEIEQARRPSILLHQMNGNGQHRIHTARLLGFPMLWAVTDQYTLPILTWPDGLVPVHKAVPAVQPEHEERLPEPGRGALFPPVTPGLAILGDRVVSQRPASAFVQPRPCRRVVDAHVLNGNRAPPALPRGRPSGAAFPSAAVSGAPRARRSTRSPP